MKKYRNYIIAAVILIATLISICFVPIDATRLIPVLEKQVQDDLGIQVHVEKLILRLGPSLKIKAPVMHLMYKDGQKFGQFDNIKLYVDWASLLKDDVSVKKIKANNFILKINSSDKYLNDLVKNFSNREFGDNPNVYFSEYSLTYNNADFVKRYKLCGKGLSLEKILNYENFKFKANGTFYINDKKHISYDLSVTPNFKLSELENSETNIIEFFNHIELLDFSSDIMADVKIFKNKLNETQLSGYLNVDNVSVLDPEKKEPKSFIYLTFLGNKTGILSNIYTSLNKKVYIEGAVSNSNKHEIDLKVKTDEINLSQLFQKVKLFADCSKFKNISSLDGTLIADFSLKGDINKVKSSGYLKINNGNVKANGINIDNIKTDVDFSNNEIVIKEAVGYVKNSPIIIKGAINKNINLELLMDKVELKNILPANYGVKNGILSLVANISGTCNNIIHKENIQVDNLYAHNELGTISVSNAKLDTNKENVAYINNVVVGSKNTETIKIPLLKLLIESENIKMPETSIYMPNSVLKARADISDYNTSNYTFSVNLDGIINSKDIKINTVERLNLPIKLNASGNKSVQNIESQLKLEKAAVLDEPALINISAKLENNAIKVEDLSVSTFSGNFSNNLKSNLKGSKKVIVTGNIENLKSPILKNIRVFVPQMLNLNFADTVAQLKGDLFINGQIKAPEIVGQLSVQNLVNQNLKLNISSLTSDFNKNIAVVDIPVLRIGDSNFSVNSTISTDFSKVLLIKNMNLKSKYINTDTIIMYKDFPLLQQTPVKILDGKLYAEHASATLYGTQVNLTALSSDFKLIENELALKNIASELYNGKLVGSLNFNLNDESFITSIQARGVSAAPIFDIIALKKDSVSGTMDFDTNINGNLTSKQSLNGDIKFVVHNGRMGTLGKLEHLLYAQNIIADNMLRTSLSVVTKAITLKDTGLFKYLRGDITLRNGIADIKMLQSQGPLMSLFVKGKYNPINDNAKLVVLGRLSDEIIAGLGSFGEFSFNKLLIMLTGEDNQLNIKTEDIEKLPQLPVRNTKEFRCIINGILEKPSSVLQFNWISYSEKSYKPKNNPVDDSKLPDFINNLPY